MKKSNLTFTCKLGTFVFEEGVILSRAKMIRDTVMGQFFSPRRGEPMLVVEQDIYEYINNESPVINNIPFEVTIREEYAMPVSGSRSRQRNNQGRIDTNW